MVYIAYFTELNSKIWDYVQKRRICREICKYALDERFHGHFCPHRNPVKSCHPDRVFFSLYNFVNRWSPPLQSPLRTRALSKSWTPLIKQLPTAQVEEQGEAWLCDRPGPAWVGADWTLQILMCHFWWYHDVHHQIYQCQNLHPLVALPLFVIYSPLHLLNAVILSLKLSLNCHYLGYLDMLPYIHSKLHLSLRPWYDCALVFANHHNLNYLLRR